MGMTKKQWETTITFVKSNLDESSYTLHELITKRFGFKITRTGLLQGLNKRGVYLNSQGKKKIRDKITKTGGENKEDVDMDEFSFESEDGRRIWIKKRVLEKFIESNLSVNEFHKRSEVLLGRKISLRSLKTMIEKNSDYVKRLTDKRLNRLGLQLGLALEFELSHDLEMQNAFSRTKKNSVFGLMNRLNELLAEFVTNRNLDDITKKDLKKDIEFCLDMIKQLKNLNMLDEIIKVRDNFFLNFQIDNTNFEDTKIITESQLQSDKEITKQFKEVIKKLAINPDLGKIEGNIIDLETDKEE